MTENGMQEKMQRASTTLATMLDYLGLEATVKAEEEGGNITLKTVSSDAGRIIGRKGQTLESLQLLLNRMMQKNDPDYPRIIIDVDGYSTKRPAGDRRSRKETCFSRQEERDPGHEERLRQQALDASKEVKRWGESVTLPPMNAHDRRIIHITLKEDPEIYTESMGTKESANLKSIVISLKKES